MGGDWRLQTKKHLLASKPAIKKQKTRIQGIMSKVENSVRAWTSGFGISFSDTPLDVMVMQGARYVAGVTKELLYSERVSDYGDPSITVRFLDDFLSILQSSGMTRLEYGHVFTAVGAWRPCPRDCDLCTCYFLSACMHGCSLFACFMLLFVYPQCRGWTVNEKTCRWIR